jgi:hypothetical protein
MSNDKRDQVQFNRRSIYEKREHVHRSIYNDKREQVQFNHRSIYDNVQFIDQSIMIKGNRFNSTIKKVFIQNRVIHDY